MGGKYPAIPETLSTVLALSKSKLEFLSWEFWHTTSIDARYTTPVVFNIYPIAKNWLEDLNNNRGFIVRVTNDDPAYEQALKKSNVARKMHRSQTSKREPDTTSTNASYIDTVCLKAQGKFLEAQSVSAVERPPSEAIGLQTYSDAE